MKLADYIANFLAERGTTHAFGMSGGAAVHLFDSIDRHPSIEIISMTHEQCAAMAADGYARASGRVGVAISTSGPGATNLLTGTCCSYYDSIPTLMLTGQVSTPRLKGARSVRQMGFQETDVVSIFSPVTKYAVQIVDAATIRYVLEKAFYIATEGRPGPVLIDIPDDLQRAEIDPAQLVGFLPPTASDFLPALTLDVDALLGRIQNAHRPIVVLGGGLKTPAVEASALQDCIERLRVPVLLTWAGLDLLPGDHPLRIGTFGVYGSRAGNFSVQNADLVIALGSRLSQNLTGGVLPSFARAAKIVMVDIDAHEMSKFDDRGLVVDLRIKARLDDFIAVLRAQLKDYKAPNWSPWTEKISHWKNIFPKDISPADEGGLPRIDAATFVEKLSRVVPAGELLYVDTGGNLTWTCNNFMPKPAQRIFSAWNHTPMGYSLPASIGAAFLKYSVTCIIGDGGLMICLAELATVVRNKLPIKIILFNNHGHGIQKQTLETWLGGRNVGVDSSSGLAFPESWERLAESFGLPVTTIRSADSVDEELAAAFATPGPIFINVEINPSQKLYPVLKFGHALENQHPLLENINIGDEMLIDPFAKDD